jgi:hypothetical protein
MYVSQNVVEQRHTAVALFECDAIFHILTNTFSSSIIGKVSHS